MLDRLRHTYTTKVPAHLQKRVQDYRDLFGLGYQSATGAIGNTRPRAIWQRDDIVNPGTLSKDMGVVYGAGRLAGDVASDATRGNIWRWNHPLAITNEVGRQIGRKTYFGPGGQALMGIALATGMDLMTGNVDLTNLDDAGRPKGYATIFPKENEDGTLSRTETANPIGEFAARYFLGRTGGLLHWDDFTKERPDVTPEQYQRYRKWLVNNPSLFSIEDANPVGTAALGSGVGAVAGMLRGGNPVKGAVAGAVAGALTPMVADFARKTRVLTGTRDGLDGPEARFMGYRIPLTALVGTGVVAAGLYGTGRYLNRAKFAQAANMNSAVQAAAANTDADVNPATIREVTDRLIRQQDRARNRDLPSWVQEEMKGGTYKPPGPALGNTQGVSQDLPARTDRTMVQNQKEVPQRPATTTGHSVSPTIDDPVVQQAIQNKIAERQIQKNDVKQLVAETVRAAPLEAPQNPVDVRHSVDRSVGGLAKMLQQRNATTPAAQVTVDPDIRQKANAVIARFKDLDLGQGNAPGPSLDGLQDIAARLRQVRKKP
jgi:hypothetical protein